MSRACPCALADVAAAKVSALMPTLSSRFWGLLEDYLPTHSICTLPLATSFSVGMGTGMFLAGKVGAGGSLAAAPRAGWGQQVLLLAPCCPAFPVL